MNIGKTGEKGESLVAGFMRKNGCTVIKRNYQCRFGEIDIIAEKGEYIIFTEVKTRREGSMYLMSSMESFSPYFMMAISTTAPGTPSFRPRLGCGGSMRSSFKPKMSR